MRTLTPLARFIRNRYNQSILEGMGIINTETIHTSSRRFRSALDSVRRHEFKSAQLGSNDFPKGASSDASLLLGIYLLNEHGVDCDYVAASDGSGSSHAWLEHEGLFIDITADRLPGMQGKVVVGEDHPVHSLFIEAGRSRISENDLSDLADDYDIVMAGMI